MSATGDEQNWLQYVIGLMLLVGAVFKPWRDSARNTEELDKVKTLVSQHRYEATQKYVSQDWLRDFESRIVNAIKDHGATVNDRFDKLEKQIEKKADK